MRRAGLRLAEHVLAFQKVRDGRRLDGRRRLVADIGQRALQRFAQGEFLEGGNGGSAITGRVGHGVSRCADGLGGQFDEQGSRKGA